MIKFKSTKLVAFLAVFVLLIGVLGGCKQGTQTPESSLPENQTTDSVQSEIPEKKINMDIVNDINLTFKQLKEKYGEVVKIDGYSGGVCYKLENSCGEYVYPYEAIEFVNGVVPKDEHSYTLFSEFPDPKDDAICHKIVRIDINKLLTGISFPANDDYVEKNFDLEFDGSGPSGGEGYNFCGYFNINDELALSISTNGYHENYGLGELWQEDDTIEDIKENLPKMLPGYNIRDIQFTRKDGTPVDEGPLSAGMGVEMTYGERGGMSAIIFTGTAGEVYSNFFYKNQLIYDTDSYVNIDRKKK